MYIYICVAQLIRINVDSDLQFYERVWNDEIAAGNDWGEVSPITTFSWGSPDDLPQTLSCPGVSLGVPWGFSGNAPGSRRGCPGGSRGSLGDPLCIPCGSPGIMLCFMDSEQNKLILDPKMAVVYHFIMFDDFIHLEGGKFRLGPRSGPHVVEKDPWGIPGPGTWGRPVDHPGLPTDQNKKNNISKIWKQQNLSIATSESFRCNASPQGLS